MLVIGVVVVASVMAVTTGVLVATTGRPEVPTAAVPRVCWFSDYANAKLSNRCTWNGHDRRWYIDDANGRSVPADTQRLPPANLCLYFYGTDCPRRR
ncbi:MAG: hypothetical protein LT070_12955 [Solirubrobacteraceae bacterium]|nr:hypothetical protein [Solirubrobacteraceae bacterium]